MRPSAELRPAAVRFFSLTTGAFFLAILVNVFCFAADEIPRRAAIGYDVGGFIMFVLGWALLAKWAPAIRGMAEVTFSPEVANAIMRVLGTGYRFLFGWLPGAEQASRVRESAGLWLPFLSILVAVAWLIHFSGGLAKSPFGEVPLMMFTLVVLLIEVPAPTAAELEAERDAEAAAAAAASEEAAAAAHDAVAAGHGEVAAEAPPTETRVRPQQEAPAPSSRAQRHRPFWILVIVVAAFYAVMMALTLASPVKVHEPDDWTGLVVTATTVIVGVPLAIVGRLRADKEAASDASVGSEGASPAAPPLVEPPAGPQR